MDVTLQIIRGVDLFHFFTPFDLFINGERTISISSKNSVSIQIPAGNHQFQVKTKHYSSKTYAFSAISGDIITLEVCPSPIYEKSMLILSVVALVFFLSKDFLHYGAYISLISFLSLSAVYLLNRLIYNRQFFWIYRLENGAQKKPKYITSA